MPSSRRRYTPAEKAKAVSLALTSANQTEAAESLGIPQRTISDWVKSADSADLVAYALGKRAQAAAEGAAHVENMVKLAVEAFERVAPNVESAEDLKHLHTSLGIFLDKLERMVSGLNSVGSGRFGTNSSLGDLASIIEQAKA